MTEPGGASAAPQPNSSASRPPMRTKLMKTALSALTVVARGLRALPGAAMSLLRWIRDAVAVIGGARRDGLAAIPGSAGRFIGMALALTFTASVAGLSAAFAMRMALHTPMWATIALGVFWGLLIFNLDRLLVVTLSKGDSRRVKLAGILSRVTVATFVSITIATPITLQIFAKEIGQQLLVQQLHQVSAFQAQQDTTTSGKQIAQDNARIRRDQAALAAGNFRNADIENRIASDTKAYNAAEKQCVLDEDQEGAEANGTGGTRTVGTGPVYDAEHQHTVRDCGVAAKDFAALQAAQDAKQAYESQQASTLTGEISSLQKTVAGLQATQASTAADYSVAVARSDGLLARISALWAIPGWVAHITHIVITLLFFTIELLPILVKSLSLLGPKNDYEQAIDEIDQTSLELLRKRNRHVLDAAERQRQAQLDTSDEMGQRIRDAQLRVFQRHLADWEAKAGDGDGQGATADQNGQGVRS
jgi:hypothetical protein